MISDATKCQTPFFVPHFQIPRRELKNTICLSCVHNCDQSRLHIFLCCLNVWSFIYSSAFFSFRGYIMNSQCDQAWWLSWKSTAPVSQRSQVWIPFSPDFFPLEGLISQLLNWVVCMTAIINNDFMYLYLLVYNWNIFRSLKSLGSLPLTSKIFNNLWTVNVWLMDNI